MNEIKRVGISRNKTLRDVLFFSRTNWIGMLSSEECYSMVLHGTPENARERGGREGKKWNKLTPIDWGRKHEGREKICIKSWYIVCLISNSARSKLIKWKWIFWLSLKIVLKLTHNQPERVSSLDVFFLLAG